MQRKLDYGKWKKRPILLFKCRMEKKTYLGRKDIIYLISCKYFFVFMKIVIGYLVLAQSLKLFLSLFITVFSKMAQSLMFLRDKIWVIYKLYIFFVTFYFLWFWSDFLSSRYFQTSTGFDLSFGNTVGKIHPFTIICWVNNDENM